MTDFSQQIVEQIPYLRRYARALTGSQQRGDEYIRVCLETLLEEPERLDAEDDIRLQLFTIFHDVWSMVDGVLPEAEATADGVPADRLRNGLATLPPKERQVLLLLTLERFSVDEVSQIVKLSPEEVVAYLERARADLRRQTSTPVLIIEDEPLISIDIARIVQEMGHTVVGTATRTQQAIDIAKRMRPGLVLADIQLEQGDSGIEAVQQIIQHIDAPVIFVTGYPERLLTGERIEPAFVVNKPFDPETLKVAIGQALSAHPPHAFAAAENG